MSEEYTTASRSILKKSGTNTASAKIGDTHIEPTAQLLCDSDVKLVPVSAFGPGKTICMEDSDEEVDEGLTAPGQNSMDESQPTSQETTQPTTTPSAALNEYPSAVPPSAVNFIDSSTMGNIPHMLRSSNDVQRHLQGSQVSSADMAMPIDSHDPFIDETTPMYFTAATGLDKSSDNMMEEPFEQPSDFGRPLSAVVADLATGSGKDLQASRDLADTRMKLVQVTEKLKTCRPYTVEMDTEASAIPSTSNQHGAVQQQTSSKEPHVPKKHYADYVTYPKLQMYDMYMSYIRCDEQPNLRHTYVMNAEERRFENVQVNFFNLHVMRPDVKEPRQWIFYYSMVCRQVLMFRRVWFDPDEGDDYKLTFRDKREEKSRCEAAECVLAAVGDPPICIIPVPTDELDDHGRNSTIFQFVVRKLADPKIRMRVFYGNYGPNDDILPTVGLRNTDKDFDSTDRRTAGTAFMHSPRKKSLKPSGLRVRLTSDHYDSDTEIEDGEISDTTDGAVPTEAALSNPRYPYDYCAKWEDVKRMQPIQTGNSDTDWAEADFDDPRQRGMCDDDNMLLLRTQAECDAAAVPGPIGIVGVNRVPPANSLPRQRHDGWNDNGWAKYPDTIAARREFCGVPICDRIKGVKLEDYKKGKPVNQLFTQSSRACDHWSTYHIKYQIRWLCPLNLAGICQSMHLRRHLATEHLRQHWERCFDDSGHFRPEMEPYALAVMRSVWLVENDMLNKVLMRPGANKSTPYTDPGNVPVTYPAEWMVDPRVYLKLGLDAGSLVHYDVEDEAPPMPLEEVPNLYMQQQKLSPQSVGEECYVRAVDNQTDWHVFYPRTVERMKEMFTYPDWEPGKCKALHLERECVNNYSKIKDCLINARTMNMCRKTLVREKKNKLELPAEPGPRKQKGLSILSPEKMELILRRLPASVHTPARIPSTAQATSTPIVTTPKKSDKGVKNQPSPSSKPKKVVRAPSRRPARRVSTQRDSTPIEKIPPGLTQGRLATGNKASVQKPVQAKEPTSEQTTSQTKQVEKPSGVKPVPRQQADLAPPTTRREILLAKLAKEVTAINPDIPRDANFLKKYHIPFSPERVDHDKTRRRGSPETLSRSTSRGREGHKGRKPTIQSSDRHETPEPVAVQQPTTIHISEDEEPTAVEQSTTIHIPEDNDTIMIDDSTTAIVINDSMDTLHDSTANQLADATADDDASMDTAAADETQYNRQQSNSSTEGARSMKRDHRGHSLDDASSTDSPDELQLAIENVLDTYKAQGPERKKLKSELKETSVKLLVQKQKNKERKRKHKEMRSLLADCLAKNEANKKEQLSAPVTTSERMRTLIREKAELERERDTAVYESGETLLKLQGMENTCLDLSRTNEYKTETLRQKTKEEKESRESSASFRRQASKSKRLAEGTELKLQTATNAAALVQGQLDTATAELLLVKKKLESATDDAALVQQKIDTANTQHELGQKKLDDARKINSRLQERLNQASKEKTILQKKLIHAAKDLDDKKREILHGHNNYQELQKRLDRCREDYHHYRKKYFEEINTRKQSDKMHKQELRNKDIVVKDARDNLLTVQKQVNEAQLTAQDNPKQEAVHKEEIENLKAKQREELTNARAEVISMTMAANAEKSEVQLARTARDSALRERNRAYETSGRIFERVHARSRREGENWTDRMDESREVIYGEVDDPTLPEGCLRLTEQHMVRIADQVHSELPRRPTGAQIARTLRENQMASRRRPTRWEVEQSPRLQPRMEYDAHGFKMEQRVVKTKYMSSSAKTRLMSDTIPSGEDWESGDVQLEDNTPRGSECEDDAKDDNASATDDPVHNELEPMADDVQPHQMEDFTPVALPADEDSSSDTDESSDEDEPALIKRAQKMLEDN